MHEHAPDGRFEAEWRARFDRFAARGGSAATISGWSEHGLSRRIEELARSLDRHAPPAAARVLDLGCGSGVYCDLLRSRGLRPVGADFSAGMLARARVLLDDGEPVPLVQADVLRLPFADASFPALVNVGVLQHIEDGSVALREMIRVLAPGGCLHLTTLNRTSLHGLVANLRAMARALAAGKLHWKKHAIRRRPETLAAIARAHRAEVLDVRGIYLFPRGLRWSEPLFAGCERRLGQRFGALVRPLANAFLLVVRRTA